MTEKKPLLERLGAWTRFALLAAIAVVLGLILTTPRDEVSGYPRFMNRAQADAVSAAPGYLLTTLGVSANEKFYLVDTNTKWIGVYGLTNDQLRLHSARKYDYDVEISEGSMPTKVGEQIVKIEGGNGITREQAKGVGKKQDEDIEALVNKGKKKP